MRSQRVRSQTENPFTLIELLVVIAIIAILAALLLPSLQKARAEGIKTACLTIHKQLMFGINFYADDFDDTIPNCANPATAKPLWAWLPELGYLPTKPATFAAVCPASPWKAPGWYTDVTLGFNYNFSSSWGTPVSFKLGRIGRQDKRCVWSCTRGRPLESGNFSGPNWYIREHLGYWHNDAANVAYLDGHAGNVRFGGLSVSYSGQYNSDPFFLPWAP